MVTDLCEGALQIILLKEAIENYQSSKACKSYRINDKAVKLIGQILHLMLSSESYFYLDGSARF